MPDVSVLLVSSDPAVLEQLQRLVPADLLRYVSDATSARRLYQMDKPDLLVLDAAWADLIPELGGGQDYAPPALVVGPPGRFEAFASVPNPADLPAWVAAAIQYRRLQREIQLIRAESERIHADLLRSYGESEQKLRLQTEELERQVDDRTRALQQSNAQLVQQEKMAALGALVAGIAHDMHTPIGTITSNSDILSRSLARLRDLISGECCPDSFRNNPDLKRVISIVDEISRVNQLASDRIIGIVRSLRNFARLDEADVRSADVHEGLDSTLTLVHHELKNRITVRREYGDIPQIQCHPNQLNQVFMNMLVNAAHAIQGTGTITIRTLREGDNIKIQISDTGSGIKPQHLPRIFDPGFTTKGVGVGTGLGLAICYKIIQDHHGSIDVESEVGRGTTFTITLPIEWKTS